MSHKTPVNWDIASSALYNRSVIGHRPGPHACHSRIGLGVHRKMKSPSRWLFPASLLILAAFMPVSLTRADDNTVLATIGGHPITAADVIPRARQRHLLSPQPHTDSTAVAQLVSDILFDSLVSREAAKISLVGDYSFWAQMRLGVTTAATAVYERDVLAPRLSFDTTQIRAYYQGHLGRYMVPHKQRLVRNITIYFPKLKIPRTYATQVDSMYLGWDPQAVADALYGRLADGEDFGELAKAHSEEPRTRPTGGALGWVSKESLPEDAFGRTCLQIPLYQISKPFRSDVGWHIVQVTAEREPGPAPIEGVVLRNINASLRDSVGAELAKRMVDSITTAGSLVVYDRTLERPDSTWQPNTPLALANGRDTILAAEYLDDIAGLKVRAKPIPSTLEEKRKVLQRVFPGLCMYKAMSDLGYLNRPEVLKRRNEIISGRKESIFRSSLTEKRYIPTDAEVNQYFQQHPAEFARPPSYMIRSLRFQNREQALQVAAAWRAGTSPDSVDSRWVEKSDVPGPVWAKLTAMAEGSVSDPVTAGADHWVVLLAQKAKPRSLADAADGIRAKLADAHERSTHDAWMNRTGERYGVVRHAARFGQVLLPSTANPEPAPPGADSTATALGGSSPPR